MTLFTTTNYPISSLIEDIDVGKIGLPELQRPFVWPNVNVRNLFDSLYKGYPAGFFLFWDTGDNQGLKKIGRRREEVIPKLAIVDGQQRLTSLYAVIKGAEVLRANFKRERIRISFNPLAEKFDVSDAAILKDKVYIPDISVLWKTGASLFDIAENYLDGLASSRDLSSQERRQVQSALSRLHNLPQYQFVALTLGANTGAETIADVFVRINGEGKKLNQADFIMTLMSVFWEEGRADLEDFARRSTVPSTTLASPYNPFIKPQPSQLLRVTVGLALKRARLSAVYSVLRGRDSQTGLDDPVKRDEQFALLQAAQSHALNLANWHHFLSSIGLAGYRGEGMITSETALIYCYVLYLVGIVDYKLDKQDVRQAIAEFFFMAALTGRYTSSPETRFESDLAMLRDPSDHRQFLNKLRSICQTTLTGDYWKTSLPTLLATSAARSPSLFAYQSALVTLGALVLYSPIEISALLDPFVKSTKSSLEQHHLFPRAYLEDEGVKDLKKINQIANFALVEWPDNIKIGKQAPAIYAAELDAKLSSIQRDALYFWHALPPLWWEMTYDRFLVERRNKMAIVIRSAWEKLTGNDIVGEPESVTVSEIIASGESDGVEFKATLRMNLHTGQNDERMHISVLKSIAAFMNAQGGSLVIGVADDGQVLGIGADNFESEDKMSLHLVNLVRDRMGEVFLPYVHPRFEDNEEERVFLIRCERGPKPAFVKDGDKQRFYVRTANSTTELSGNSITDYAKQRFA
jgi:hypothetical protein